MFINICINIFQCLYNVYKNPGNSQINNSLDPNIMVSMMQFFETEF